MQTFAGVSEASRRCWISCHRASKARAGLLRGAYAKSGARFELICSTSLVDFLVKKGLHALAYAVLATLGWRAWRAWLLVKQGQSRQGCQLRFLPFFLQI